MKFNNQTSKLGKLMRGATEAVTATKTSTNKTSAKVRGNYERFIALTEKYWKFTLDTCPEMASYYGHKEYNDRLSHFTKQSFAARRNTAASALEAVNRLFPNAAAYAGLDRQEKLNVKVFVDRLNDTIKSIDLDVPAYCTSSLEGPQAELTMLIDQHAFDNAADFEIYLSRLEQIPRYLKQVEEYLDEASDRGVGPPKICVDGVVDQINKMVKAEPCEFAKPLTETFDKVCSGVAADALKERINKTIREEVIPAFERFGVFVGEVYLPKLRDEVALSASTGGAELYQYFMESYTTTKMTADEIHELGLQEVQRIQDKMLSIAKGAGFDSVSEYNTHLAADRQYVCKTSEELLNAYKAACMEIYPNLPKLFKTLPRIPFGVKAIPDYLADQIPGAYYQSPPPDGSQPGWFSANVSDLESGKLYQVDALVLHEAIPGHHFQLALQVENGDLPDFRKHAHYTAYIEGWGLHSEQLGYELGMYKTPESQYGGLTLESLRACRLVVDTGMHAKGWTKQQAMDYMLKNQAGTLQEVDGETTRYCSIPGQALAYKVGEITIRRLKQKAQDELGAAFDVREFYDVVLSGGALPLTILEELVNEFIEKYSP